MRRSDFNYADLDPRPELLLYCQHSLGLGHLVRSLALADGLSEYFHVVLLNGGRLPAGTVIPNGVTLVNLPPLGHDDSYELVSHDAAYTVAEAMHCRTAIIGSWLARRPQVVLIELYPFGRKKFAFELEPLLQAAAAMGPDRPFIACSLRDILVGQRRDQARHDERACLMANRYFDAILVHADPRFARLDESFRPDTALTVPVHYTGFVGPARPMLRPGPSANRVVVSAGGGMVGEPLFRAAVGAAPAIYRSTGLETTIVAGPFAPPAVWEWLVTAAQANDRLHVVRRVDDLAAEMARSAITISQCGYNTTMDILHAQVPAIVVPYAEGREDEQTRRAERLRCAGVVHTLSDTDLTATRLAEAVAAMVGTRPTPTTLDIDGRHRTAALLAELASCLV